MSKVSKTARLSAPVRLAAGLLAMLAVSSLPASAAEIAGIPANNVLHFSVMRDGDQIGTHDVMFSNEGDNLSVDISTDVHVKMPLLGITLYEFTHEGHERWHDGVLESLSSQTNDDGESKTLNVVKAGEVLQIESNTAAHQSRPGIMPASLWNPDVVGQGVLLNTLDGSEMTVTIDQLGSESIEAGGTTVEANHLRISGDLERDVWYTSGGVLVGVQFKGEDGSDIRYVLN